MRPLPATDEILRVAERVIWFEPARAAIADPIRFLAYLMRYGTAAEVEAVSRHVDGAEWREAIENAPAGIIDARSWAYWNIMAGFDPALPLPARRLRSDSPQK